MNAILVITMLLSCYGQAEYANGISAGIVQKNVGNPSEVNYDDKNNSNGREYKAGDAAKTGNAGQVMGIVTGSALVAAAVPLLNSPFPWDQAAGADLMAKAALEFAQAGTDNSSSSQNNGQKNLLTGQYGPTGSNYPDKPQVNNPDLDRYLSQRGIDPSEYKKRLLDGELNNRDAVMGALGLDSDLDSEDMARARSIADNKFSSLLGLPPISSESEQHPADDTNSRFENTGGYANSADATPNTFQATAENTGTNANVAISKKATESDTENSTDLPTTAEGFSIHNVLTSLMGGVAPAMVSAEAAALAGLSRTELESRGIKKILKKQNIFEISQKKYRNFGKWRKASGRVASASR